MNEAMFITSNKIMAKKILNYNNIPTPEDENTLPFIKDKYIIKAVWEHASIDMDESNLVYAENPGQLKNLILEKNNKCNKIFFAERYIDGREFNISVLAGKVLPFAEIDFSNFDDKKLKIIDYKAKWKQGSFEYNNTPRKFNFKDEDKDLLKNIENITRKCWQIFNLKGYARVDFRVDKSNRPYVLEINSNPCISSDSGFYAAAIKAGFTVEKFIEHIIAEALCN